MPSEPPNGALLRTTTNRRVALLAVVVVIQCAAVVFYIGDVVQEVRWTGPDLHTVLESLVTAALVLGTGLGIYEMRRTLARTRDAERALSAASGAFQAVVTERFGEWQLTRAERDVAMLVLKGVETADIAQFRGSAQGTVRAQLAQVYAKSGSSSRSQFVSQFVEDLLDGPVAPIPQP